MRQLCFLPACSQPPGLSKKLLSLPVTPPTLRPVIISRILLEANKRGKGKTKRRGELLGDGRIICLYRGCSLLHNFMTPAKLVPSRQRRAGTACIILCLSSPVGWRTLAFLACSKACCSSYKLLPSSLSTALGVYPGCIQSLGLVSWGSIEATAPGDPPALVALSPPPARDSSSRLYSAASAPWRHAVLATAPASGWGGVTLWR